ncbi:DUF1648 domain-containing protein [Pseudochryseolinea flava]|uniref:DUF1648 domain-containing protein n=1 Tax=Pseudochryseolinea flava TaxID=2059302 RepID=A0A364Y9C5_9BACT|nr:DUF1648 domain-containing protein [Pseudochryseolinea flava]RAW03065.1 hypothetical protein DQQ10_02910 [Pseudochryseolinea flava]
MSKDVQIPALTLFDQILEVFGALFLLSSIGIPIFFFQKLPAVIPIHFDFAGVPNGTGSKINVLIAPALGAAVYVGIFLVKRYSNRMNYPVPVTDANRATLLKLSLRMMRWIRVIIAIFFTLLVVSMVRVGLGYDERADMFLMIYFLLALIAVVSYYMYQMIQQHKEPEE